jgi:hypothetical protein
MSGVNFFPIHNSPREGDPEPIGQILVGALSKLFKSWQKGGCPRDRKRGASTSLVRLSRVEAEKNGFSSS